MCILLYTVSVIIPSSLWAQTATGKSVIFPSRSISVTTALNEIERQMGYDIAVNWKNVDTGRVIMLSANKLSVESTLNEVFAGTNLEWEIIGNTIAIVNGEKPARISGPIYSTMNRNRLPDGMTVVADPYSQRQISEDEITRIANGYWRSDNEKVTDSIGLVTLNFRVNSTTLERDYMDNARALNVILRTFSDKQMLTDMDFITVIAASSPEGNTTANDKLAAGRARAVKSYIMWKYPFMNRERIFTFSIGEDWTGLKNMVAEDWNVPYQGEVLRVLDSGGSSDAMRSSLKRIGGGRAYRYIADNLLPRLRGAAACMIYYKQKPEPASEPIIITEHTTDTVYVEREVRRDSIVEVPVTAPTQTHKPYYWSLKTNLLYDAVLLPDLHAEFSIARRWSVELGGQLAWWTNNKSNDYTWRIQTAGIEGRFWLGNRNKRTPLSGHFLGVYGMAGTYDVRFGGKTGYLSDMSYSAGISYGYAARVSRSLNLELGISVGYVGGEYETYHLYDESEDIFYRDGRFNRHYFGPTKARVSLVWLLDGKNPDRKR